MELSSAGTARRRNNFMINRVGEGRDGVAWSAELGFADQAHLTRTVRAQLGHTPGELRRLLA